MASSPETRKALGAFYTDEVVVRFLVEWGMRRHPSRVLDPSCGDGRFLRAAASVGAPAVVGCDVDPEALAATREALGETGAGVQLVASDFFAVEPDAVEPVDLVVGNPPFIRYQRFSGETRRLALARALRQGVRLTQLASSWAPFLLHALQFLRPGGDLAMVVPAEILQTQYGRPTLRALADRFGAVSLLTFERNLFEDAQADTLLLLAADFGRQSDGVRLVPLVDAADLLGVPGEGAAVPAGVPLALSSRGRIPFAEALLTPEERGAWHQVLKHSAVRTVGSLGTVANGYVSGDNDFFHRTAQAARESGIPRAWLRPAARSSRSLSGLEFTAEDVEAAEAGGEAHHLVLPDEGLYGRSPEALDRFIAEGVAREVDRRFKCRTRSPWWRVPGLLRADVLLGYMAGARPKAAVNRAGAVYTNTLHGLRLAPGVSPEAVAMAMHSSLTLLSLELEGRSYGGGILKLEPTEMASVRIAVEPVAATTLKEHAREVDALLRAGSYDEAVGRVDELLLRGVLGLSPGHVERLRAARQRLVERRCGRSRRRVNGSGC